MRLLSPCFLILALLTAATASAAITRSRVENFTVAPGSRVEVKINGGPIDVKIGAAGQVHVELIQTVQTNSEKEADERIAKTEPIIAQKGDSIRIALEPDGYRFNWSKLSGDHGVQYKVNLVVPAEITLDLDTSGGPINVAGEIHGDLRANTSGGPITVTGSAGKIDLDTSGGNISVDRVLRRIHADTSGGSIHIGYVGPDAENVNVDTSGGEISIGLDASGGFDLDADTSGGEVKVTELDFSASKKDRTHAEGKIRGGGARVQADTSGGSIHIHAARP